MYAISLLPHLNYFLLKKNKSYTVPYYQIDLTCFSYCILTKNRSV